MRPTALIAAAILASGGGGAATAAFAGVWSPWAQRDPFAKVVFQLPSGKSCEFRLGDVTGAPDGLLAVLQEAFEDYEIDAGSLRRAADHLGLEAADLDTDAGFASAARWAAALHAERALLEHGFEAKHQFAGEGICI